MVRKCYEKPMVNSLDVQPDSQVLQGSITNQKMMVNTVTVDDFDEGGIKTLDFDSNSIY